VGKLSNNDVDKPIQKYVVQPSEADRQSVRSQYKPLKQFKGQDLELYYMEKQLNPSVEQEIKEGFFEIKKKFGDQSKQPMSEEVQVYVSHLCL
jgi:hypothetical protein